jgi:adenine/guanine phosphoribosyltransferase-like PRPP-binding protein
MAVRCQCGGLRHRTTGMSARTRPGPYRADWEPPAASAAPQAQCFASTYPVRLRDGSHLVLPLKPLPMGDKAVALLMANQCSFAIERRVVERLEGLVRGAAPDAVVGIPTLGLTYASRVAEAVGLPDFVALGHSRKYWYDDTLSEVAVSSTSPDQSKRVYLDPALLNRVQQRRIVIVDDVLNTGGTMTAAVRLLQRAQAEVVAIIAVLTEGWDWHRALARIDPMLPEKVHALGHIPLFGRVSGGWAPLPDTELAARPG